MPSEVPPMSSSSIQSQSAPVAVILAAGKGTRMGSDLPKVMHQALGRPLVEWVVNACVAAGCARIVLVVGHGAGIVQAHFAGRAEIEFVTQQPQLGTGHAVDQARHLLAGQPAGQDILVLCGDGPLIRASTITALLSAHRSSGAAATLATSVIPDADGYGRIVRDDKGDFSRIAEHKDASAAERAIREINPSYYCFQSGDLWTSLARLDNANSQREYYITDLFRLLPASGRRVHVVDAVPPEEVLSVNTPQQLAEVESILRARGASLVSGGAA